MAIDPKKTDTPKAVTAKKSPAKTAAKLPSKAKPKVTTKAKAKPAVKKAEAPVKTSATSKAAPKKKPTVKAAKPKAAVKPKAAIKPKAEVKPKVEAKKSSHDDHASSQSNERSYKATSADTHNIGMTDKLWRLVGMVAFALIGQFVFYALLILAAMQYVVSFIGEAPNDEIKAFMTRLIAYFGEIFAFMSFQTEDMPFPFKPFPKD